MAPGRPRRRPGAPPPLLPAVHAQADGHSRRHGESIRPAASFPAPRSRSRATRRGRAAARSPTRTASSRFRDAAPGRYEAARVRSRVQGRSTASWSWRPARRSGWRSRSRWPLSRRGAHIDDSEPPLIETSHAALGLLIPNRDLIELPLNGRNFTQLGTLMPGVIAPPAALGGQAGDATPGGFGNATGGFNVNGMRNQSNNFLLDGAPNNDSFNTGFVLRPPPDAIDEFRIFTHAFNAEYGRNAGAVVSVVTRGGSREWRGSGWWFDRDDALEARNRFAVTKPALDQHQFGGTAGGPMVENKAFVFGYYEGFRNRRGTTDTRVVPSAAQRAGDFSGGPAIRDPLTGQPFPGNVIPPARLDAIAAQLLDDYVPLPNQPGNRYTQSPDVLDRRHQFGVRVDHNVNDVEQGAGARARRPHRAAQSRSGQPTSRRPATWRGRGLLDALVSDTTVFGPDRRSNEARVSINRIDAEPNVTSGLDPRDLGFAITPSNPTALGLPNIGVNGFFTLGDAQQPFASRVNDVLTIADDLTKVAGPPHRQGRRRGAPRSHRARVHQPAERQLHLQRAVHRQRRRRLPARPAAAVPAGGRRPEHGRPHVGDERLRAGRLAGRGRAQRPGRPALRARRAVRRARRQAERVPPRPAVDALSGGAGRARLSRRPRRAARHLRDRRQQRRAARRRRLGRRRRRHDRRPRRLGDVLRHAGRAGRLLPERDAGAAVPAADRGDLLGRVADAALPGPARRASAGSVRLPAGAHLHRLGAALHDAAGAARPPVPAAQRRATSSASRSPTSASRARAPADVHGSEPDDAGARADAAAGSAAAAGVRPRPAQPGRGAVVVRLAAGERHASAGGAA